MNKLTVETELFTVQQAAEFLNISPATIRLWAYQSEESGTKVGIRSDWRFTKEELEALAKPNVLNIQSLEPAQHTHTESHQNHIVQFYEDDEYLLNSVKDFILNGDVGVIIATPQHRAMLETSLSHITKHAHQQELFFLDAEETLEKFMLDDYPDPALFDQVIGSLLRDVSKDNKKVRAFGEMVAILWEKGNPNAAIRLEELWNDLLVTLPFHLFCAYPMKSFEGQAQNGDFEDVCNTHGGITPSESYASLSSDEERNREIALLQQKASSLSVEIEKSKALERSLTESNMELEDFFVNGAIGIHWVALDGKILRANKAELKMLGYTQEEYVGHDIRDFHVSAEKIQEILTCLSEGRTLTDCEAQLRCKDGSIKDVLINSNVLWKDGVFIHTRCFTLDITERKNQQSLIKQEEKRKDDFLAVLAHELRNPLAPIGSAVEILELNDSLEGEDKWAVDIIHRQLYHMTRLIDDLLDISRITGNKLELQREKVDLNDVVKVALETSNPVIEEGRHTLINSFPSGGVYVHADFVRLAQVISNLLINAAKYTPYGGTIWLTIEQVNNEAVVSVRDTGVGISSDLLPRIFDMFVQGQRAHNSRRGLGIGLTLVKSIIEMHHGTVIAESDGPTKGSTFILRLPLSAPDIKASDEKQTLHAKDLSSLRILIVDDNTDALKTMQKVLQLQGGKTEIANDGLEGAHMAQTFEPHVVLLDIGMPKMDGYETAKLIRSQTWGKKIKLIAITGWGQSTDKIKAEEAGFDHHMTKPVDSKALSQLLSTFIIVD